MSKTSYKLFLKNVVVIGITQALLGLSDFFLLPIITKTLGEYDYGIWSQINITVYLLSSMALMGLSMGFVRFMSSKTDINEIQEGVYSITIFVMVSGFLASMLLYFFATPLAIIGFKDPETSYFIKVGAFLVFFNALNQLSIFYFRVTRQINMYSYLTLFQVFGKMLLIFAFLLMGYGLFGVIIASLILQILLFIFMNFKIVSELGFSMPKFSHLREYLEFSLPLAPNLIFRWITDSSDRYMVTYFLGLGCSGIYSATYSIGMIIKIFITPLQFILLPEISKLYDEGKIDQMKVYLEYSLKYFLLITIPAVFGLSAIASPLLQIFTTSSFVDGVPVVSIIALSNLFSGVFQIIINITHVVKKTKFNMYIHVFAALFNISANIFLIPSFGIIGAAISTLGSYILMVIICYHISFKYINFDLNLIIIFKSIISSIIMYKIILLLNPSSISGLVVSVTLGIIVYILSIFLTEGIGNKELKIIRDVCRKVKNIISFNS